MLQKWNRANRGFIRGIAKYLAVWHYLHTVGAPSLPPCAVTVTCKGWEVLSNGDDSSVTSSCHWVLPLGQEDVPEQSRPSWSACSVSPLTQWRYCCPSREHHKRLLMLTGESGWSPVDHLNVIGLHTRHTLWYNYFVVCITKYIIYKGM